MRFYFLSPHSVAWFKKKQKQIEALTKMERMTYKAIEFFPKISMKYSKNGQKFATSKNTSNMLFEDMLNTMQKTALLDHDTLFFEWPITRPLACPFARSLTPLICLLAPNCLRFFSVLDHSARRFHDVTAPQIRENAHCLLFPSSVLFLFSVPKIKCYISRYLQPTIPPHPCSSRCPRIHVLFCARSVL